MKESNTAARLRQVMREQKLKQVDILEKAKPYCEHFDVKLTKSALSHYVAGKVEPRQDKLSVLSYALNVSEAWLMGYDVPMERTSPIPDITVDRWAEKFKSGLEKYIGVADPSDVSDAYMDVGRIQAVLDNKLPLTFEAACNIADELGVSIDAMVGRKTNSPPSEFESDETKEAFRLLKTLPVGGSIELPPLSIKYRR
jgi:transcriptional regulator with XRE-family HTH domain